MKKYLYTSLVFIIIGLGYYQASNNTMVIGPKDAINQNIKKLKSSGEISADQENLVKLQLAIVDYMSLKHAPPDNLEVLVPKYFDSLPLNPNTKAPFRYERRGDNYVILDMEHEVGKTPSVGMNADKVKDEFLNPNNLVIEEYVYNAEGKRDPFVPFDLAPKNQIGEDVPPLERYDLAQLKVSAVLSDKLNGMVAIVEDATGKGYTVKVGSRIGDKNGTIVSIDSTQINVLERTTDFTGETKQDLRSIKLQKATDKPTAKKKRN